MSAAPAQIRDLANDVYHLLSTEKLVSRSPRTYAYRTMQYLRAVLALVGTAAGPVAVHLAKLVEGDEVAAREDSSVAQLLAAVPTGEGGILVLVTLLPFFGLWIWYQVDHGERRSVLSEATSRRLRTCRAELSAEMGKFSTWPDVAKHLDEVKFHRILPHLKSACDEGAYPSDFYPAATAVEARAQAEQLISAVEGRIQAPTEPVDAERRSRRRTVPPGTRSEAPAASAPSEG